MVGRPFKNGLDYWIVYNDVFEDPRLQDLEDEYGLYPHTILDRIITLINVNGYYYKEDNLGDVAKWICRKYKGFITLEKVNEIITAIASSGLLDAALAREGVFTSVDRQIHYYISTKRRKKRDIEKYWLLNEKEIESLEAFLSVTKNSDLPINVNNNQINVDNNPINANGNKHSSVQFSSDSVKSTNDRKDKNDKTSCEERFVSFLINKGYLSPLDVDIPLYSELFKDLLKQFEYKNINIAIKYFVSNAGEMIGIDMRNYDKIFAKFEYFKESITNSLTREYDRAANWWSKNIDGASEEEFDIPW